MNLYSDVPRFGILLLFSVCVYGDITREDTFFEAEFSNSHKGRMLRVLMSFNNIGLELCVVKCIQHIRCKTVNYHFEKVKCELTDVDFNDAEADEISHGWYNYGTQPKVKCELTDVEFNDADFDKISHGWYNYGTQPKVNGQWDSWRNVTRCSATCGGGTMNQARDCDSPKPAHGGDDCVGNGERTIECNKHKCPEDGHWSQWGSWSACSQTAQCAKGVRTRTRTCDNPSPIDGGAPCPGNATESNVCEVHCSHECYFDDTSNCGYSIISGTWQLRSGSTPSYYTGPSSDVSGKGSYLYTETSNSGHPSRFSKFLSPFFQSAGPKQCYSFYYHMYGSTIGSLAVYIVDPNGTRSEMWREEKDQGDEWIKAEFDIKRSSQYQILFEAISGKRYTGDIAIDNLVLNETSCVSGNWSAWRNVTTCNAKCGGGSLQQKRHCHSPKPQHGGISCTGKKERTIRCNTQICQVVNIALGKSAEQSSTYKNDNRYQAKKGNDGNETTYSLTDPQDHPWWKIDLGFDMKIKYIILRLNRSYRYRNVHIYGKRTSRSSYDVCRYSGYRRETYVKFSCYPNQIFRFIRIIMKENNVKLAVKELEVYVEQ